MTNPTVVLQPTFDDSEVINDLVQTMIRDRRIRTEVTRTSHMWFFLTYFADYVKHPFAPFHREMFALSEDVSNPMLAIMAFRGSAKSTFFSLSYPIWAILGQQQAKFIVIVGQTQQQARQYLTNLKRELERNDLLRRDLGPFEERDEEWSAGSIVIPKYDARITAISCEQGIRGLRHGSHRPDIIICDDLENLESVKTRESRQKLYQWLLGEVIPAGDINTRLIIIGNCLHDDGLMMRLKREIEVGERRGVFRSYPLLDDDGKCLWPGKFTTPESIAYLKLAVVDEATWQREFLLRIIASADQVCDPSWIQYYDELPAIVRRKSFIVEVLIGVDLAISESVLADYTAFVPIVIYSDLDDNWCAYVLPEIRNQRIPFTETVDQLAILSHSLVKDQRANVYVEDVGIQRALTQMLEERGVSAYSKGLRGLGKRERIALVTPAIKNGRVKFPKEGAEELISQLVGFGRERHDDIVDAFTLVVRKILEEPPYSPRITIIDNLWGRY
jgi:predicted phage terminase large subunit-like protein